MKNFKKLLLVFLPILTLSLVFSCSNDDDDDYDNGNDQENKNIKFTVTVNDVEEQDYVSFVFVGSDYDNSKTVWKINGVTQNNENAISLDKNDFLGSTKTYVIESTKPLRLITTSSQCLNPGANNPSFKVSFKAEVNGKVVTNDENFTVTSTSDYSHKYDY